QGDSAGTVAVAFAVLPQFETPPDPGLKTRLLVGYWTRLTSATFLAFIGWIGSFSRCSKPRDRPAASPILRADPAHPGSSPCHQRLCRRAGPLSLSLGGAERGWRRAESALRGRRGPDRRPFPPPRLGQDRQGPRAGPAVRCVAEAVGGVAPGA